MPPAPKPAVTTAAGACNLCLVISASHYVTLDSRPLHLQMRDHSTLSYDDAFLFETSRDHMRCGLSDAALPIATKQGTCIALWGDGRTRMHATFTMESCQWPLPRVVALLQSESQRVEGHVHVRPCNQSEVVRTSWLAAPPMRGDRTSAALGRLDAYHPLELTTCQKLLSDIALKQMCGDYEWGDDLTAQEACASHVAHIQSEGCQITCTQLLRLWRRLSGCETWKNRMLRAVSSPLPERCVALKRAVNSLTCSVLID